MSGRGRGVSNAPAWMSRQSAQEKGGGGPSGLPSSPPRSRSRSRSPQRDSYGRSSRGGGGGGGHSRGGDDRRPRYDDRSRGRHNNDGPSRRGFGGPPGRDHRDYPPHRGGGGGRPRGNGGGGGRPHRNDVVQFRSAQEERDWLEERRRRRRARKSAFDVPPTKEQLELEKAQAAAAALTETDRPGPAAQGPKRTSSSVTHQQPQQTRHARRLYIGQLPLEVNEAEVHQFFKECIKVAMDKTTKGGEEDPILSVYINRERRFSFVEFRTMEVCTACLALDGINLLGKGKVKVKRPNDYNPAMAVEPPTSSTLNFDVSRLGIVSGSVPDGPNKIFIGGLPYHLTEDQVLELLGAFGQVRAFHLVKADALAVTSKGYCFVEYSDSNVTAVAVMGLNGMAMGGDKVLSARMAAARGTVPPATNNLTVINPTSLVSSEMEQEQARARMAQQIAGVDVEALLNAALDGAVIPPPGSVTAAAPPPPTPMMMMPPNGLSMDPNNYAQTMADAALNAALGGLPPTMTAPPRIPLASPPSKILILLNMVNDEDLATEEDYVDLFDEVKGECSKFGNLVSMKIPRLKDGYEASAVKKIFLEYATVNDAMAAEKELAGRQFGPNVVQAKYLPEEDFAAGRLK